jgi:hypothetical protein
VSRSCWWSLSFWLSHQNPICISLFSCMLHVLPISSFLTWLFLLYLVKSTSYEAPHYAVFYNFLSFHPSWVKIFSSAPFLQIPSVCVRTGECRE